MSKKSGKDADFIEFIENAEGNEMPYEPRLDSKIVEVAKVPNASRAKGKCKK
ncbi:MAG: hypothetical protein FWF59_11360 [Turicibacter sp.]|nr:hypothetical protein [Turicibacter sp.]